MSVKKELSPRRSVQAEVEVPGSTQSAVAHLIDEAIARNLVRFASAGRGSVVIRSASAKQRRRRRPD